MSGHKQGSLQPNWLTLLLLPFDWQEQECSSLCSQFMALGSHLQHTGFGFANLKAEEIPLQGRAKPMPGQLASSNYWPRLLTDPSAGKRRSSCRTVLTEGQCLKTKLHRKVHFQFRVCFQTNCTIKALLSPLVSVAMGCSKGSGVPT